MMFVTEPGEHYADDDPIIQRLQNVKVPFFLVINKIDTVDDGKVLELIKLWNDRISFTETIPVSALQKVNTERLMEVVMKYLPEGPAFYPKDQLTDRPERFFVSEIIREKILLLYQQEIPYSCEVIVTSFKDGETKKGEPLVRIGAEIFVARKTQKSIIIGKGGSAIKKLGMEARKSIEEWLESKVFLELHVKVKDNWRDDERSLKHFGY
jgi:GTP-binding protein Era